MRGRQIIFLAAMIALTLATTSEAGAIFTVGNHPQQPGEENVFLNKGTTGTTVFGTIDQSDLTVQFTSTSSPSPQTLTEPANGQARIEATNGTSQIALTDVTISVPSGTFTDLIFNPHIGGTVGTEGGTATVTAIANDGTFPFTYTLGNGENFLTITTNPGEILSSVSISYPTGFTDLEQVRISGAAVVPEPASATVMAIGVAITATAAFVLRRRNRRLVQAS